MKRKISNYCVGLLVLINCFGLYQANKQNKNPFANNTQNISSNEKRDFNLNGQQDIESNHYEAFQLLSINQKQ
jgi:hypothetical protein